MAKFIVIGERIHCISPTIRQAMETMTPGPILDRAREQLEAGATYLDVNIGPAEKNGPELMQWAVKLLQENFDTRRSKPAFRFTTAARESPLSTLPMPGIGSRISTWLPRTTPSASPSAPKPAFPATMTNVWPAARRCWSAEWVWVWRQRISGLILFSW